MQGLAALGAFAVVFTAACFASAREAPRARPTGARPTEICVLRAGPVPSPPLAPQTPGPAGPAGGDATYVVRDNGMLVATVGQDYFCYAASPGAHHVAVEVGAKSAVIDVSLTPGERVFLQQSLSDQAVALARLSEAAPVSSPSVAAAPEAKPSPPAPPPPPPPRIRPDGLVYGVDAGLGLASTRNVPATRATASFAALGSILIGFWPNDFLLLTGRIDASLMNGVGDADFAAHLGLFPGTESPGPLRNFMLFVDVGAAVPISGASAGLSTAPPIAAAARIGVGWQRWRVGPTLIGPLLCGQIVQASGEADAGVIVGLTASLDSQTRPK